jgi:hypothetical protein
MTPASQRRPCITTGRRRACARITKFLREARPASSRRCSPAECADHHRDVRAWQYATLSTGHVRPRHRVRHIMIKTNRGSRRKAVPHRLVAIGRDRPCSLGRASCTATLKSIFTHRRWLRAPKYPVCVVELHAATGSIAFAPLERRIRGCPIPIANAAPSRVPSPAIPSLGQLPTPAVGACRCVPWPASATLLRLRHALSLDCRYAEQVVSPIPARHPQFGGDL